MANTNALTNLSHVSETRDRPTGGATRDTDSSALLPNPYNNYDTTSTDALSRPNSQDGSKNAGEFQATVDLPALGLGDVPVRAPNGAATSSTEHPPTFPLNNEDVHKFLGDLVANALDGPGDSDTTQGDLGDENDFGLNDLYAHS